MTKLKSHSGHSTLNWMRLYRQTHQIHSCMDDIEFIPEEGLDIQFTHSDSRMGLSEEEWEELLIVFQS